MREPFGHREKNLIMKSHRGCAWIMVFALMFCAAAWAQDTASITGTITDPSGAAVANAQVAVRNAEHGISRSSTSNGSGDFLFASLPIGSYDLTIEAQGFKKYEAKGVTLVIAQKARVNVALEVGTISTEVVVQGSEVAQVETQSSDLGNTISGKEISQLELNGRDFTQLVTLSPGVTNQSGQDEGGEGATTVAFSINGGRTEYNNFEIDGGDALDNGSNTTINVYPSIDAIAEVKVLTSNYGAQYGKNGSGTVEVETKSGTNQFHGDLYEFLRNDDFNATQFGLTSVPEYKKNDFGFTIGGPVYIPGHYNASRQKTFFFWSEEWRRDLTPASGFFSQTIVPTMADRTGNFNDQCSGAAANLECPTVPAFINGVAQPVGNSPGDVGQPFVGNQVPIQNSDISSALTALIPAPNGVSSDGLEDQWYATPTLPTHWRQELFKIDHNINDKVRASFRYIHDSWNQQYPVPLWTAGTTFPTIQTNFNNPGVSMVARLTANVSPTLLNEFVASYTTDHISTQLTGPWQRGNVPASLGLYDNGSGGRVPGISLTDGQYIFAEDPGYVPNGPLNSNPTFTFRDNVTKIAGPHNIQFGIYFTDSHKNEIPQPPNAPNGLLGFANSDNGSTVSTGNAYADLLLGNIGSFSQQQAQLKLHNFYHIYEPYVQDDWHVSPRLTLNLGLRISFYGTYRELNNLAYNFDPAFYVPGASGVDPATGLVTGNPYNGWVDCGVTPGVPKGCMSNHWFNPAPRVGFAFDPRGDGKWAIRGGYGIFFEHTNGNESNTDLLEPDNIKTQTTSVVNISGYANLNSGLLGGGTPPLTATSIPSKAIWPYVQQWHLDIQHDLGRGTVATLSYVGSAGVHLTRAYTLNEIAPVPASQNPYGPGQVITPDDCASVAIGADGQATATANVDAGNTVTMTGGWANNLAVACGNNPNFYRPYLGWASIGRKDQTATSNYNGLEVSVRHNIGGLELNGAYTYSHSIDDSSSGNDAGLINAYNLNAYRASSNFDQRHTVTLAYVYDLPFFKGRGLAHSTLGGWQWSGITLIQSGSPFSVYNSGNGAIAPSDNAGVGTGASQIGNLGGLTGGSYPDLVGNPRQGVQNTPFAGFGPLLFNPAAFVAPQGLTFGDAGRNILNNPWRTNFDMALLKHFAVTESKYFEFRAEAFNVFNHTEFNWLGGDGGSASSNAGAGNTSSTVVCYGGANNSAGDPSCLPGVLFRPGAAHNARILQLALKFIF
jgi:Carboxypeptidase regulatory-like domain/TonB-dependent Receptor Plug Domain